jgi:GTPase
MLVSENHLSPTFEFEIEATIVLYSSTIKIGYQSVINSHVVRQTSTITGMNKEFIRAGDTVIIQFKFLKKPEYLHMRDIVLFREGRTRGKGKIINIFPFDLNKYNEEKKAINKKKKANIANKNKIVGMGKII